MKIYTEKTLCLSSEASALNPVLAFHWDGVSKTEREQRKSNPLSPFTLVDDPDASDICVLPKEWNYYLWHKKQDEAEALANSANRAGKKILIWFRGDLPPRILFKNAVVFKCAMERSRKKANQFAAPYFIDDPTVKFSQGEITPRKKGVKPRVGFCGYAAINPAKVVYSILANCKSNLEISIGRSNYESSPIIPATLLRARALKLLSKSRAIDANFIVRDKYRAGVRKESKQLETVAGEFFNNIYDSDYVLCVRGYGNWSARLYETLACGRIPIFIDTDCVLPFDFALDWKKLCVWVDSREISRLSETVADFHARLRPDEFIELQRACRRLWIERLSISGFMTHLSEHFAFQPETVFLQPGFSGSRHLRQASL
jgi:hypothetical protein